VYRNNRLQPFLRGGLLIGVVVVAASVDWNRRPTILTILDCCGNTCRANRETGNKRPFIIVHNTNPSDYASQVKKDRKLQLTKN
jgi:hypothetical protein